MAEPVTAPRRRPRAGGIKDVIDGFVEQGRISVSQGGLVWEDSVCGTLSTTRAGCYDTATPADPKTGSGVGQFTTIGDPFARYAGVECFLGGDSVGATFEAQARERLELLEDREVEEALWTWAAAAPDTGAATSIRHAVGVADEMADQDYIGQPVILMSRLLADEAFADGVLVHDSNGRLITANRTPVVATGSVPDVDDDTKIAVIGWPEVYASPILARQAPDLQTNTDFAIAERVYAIGVDCDFRVAITITPPVP